MDMKLCKDCQQEKPYSEFYMTGGHYGSYCKTCHYTRTHVLKALKELQCPACDQIFMQTDHNQIYCSSQCRTTNWARNHRDKVLAGSQRHRAMNRGLYASYAAKRRASKLQATPNWLSQEQREEITQFYISCPEGYHVDHIYPLISDEVCGLHVPWNLQYLPAKENSRKGNRIGGGIHA